MQRKIIGLFIFIFFIFGCVILEGGSIADFLAPTAILLVLGITGGLLLMYSEKGLEKCKLLKKAKHYFIFSGYLSAIIAIIMILAVRPVDELQSFERTMRTLSAVLLSILYGYAFAYITDTFIHE